MKMDMMDMKRLRSKAEDRESESESERRTKGIERKGDDRLTKRYIKIEDSYRGGRDTLERQKRELN